MTLVVPVICRGDTRPARGSKLTLLSLERVLNLLGGSYRLVHGIIKHCQASKTAFRSRCARPGEAFCPNIQPRAHARLTGLTTSNIVCYYVMGAFVCCDKRNRNFTSAPASLDMTYR